MKKNIALMMVLLVAGTAFAAGYKPRKNSRTEMGIHGNALYVIEYTYNLHGGRDGGRQLISIDSITFDKRGNFAPVAPPTSTTRTATALSVQSILATR